MCSGCTINTLNLDIYFFYPKFHTISQIGTSTIHSDIIGLHSDAFNFTLRINANKLIGYLSGCSLDQTWKQYKTKDAL